MERLYKLSFCILNLLNLLLVVTIGFYLYIPSFVGNITGILIKSYYPISQLMSIVLILVNIVLVLIRKKHYIAMIIFCILHLIYAFYIFTHLGGFFAGV